MNIFIISSNSGAQRLIDYSVIFHFTVKERLNSRHLHHRMASFRAAVPLLRCHHDWIRHGGGGRREATCLIPASDPSCKFKIESWETLREFWETVDYTTWFNFITHPACMGDNLPEAAAARHKQTPHPTPALWLLPLLQPAPSCRTWVWMGAAWLSPADKSWLVLLLLGGGKKDVYAQLFKTALIVFTHMFIIWGCIRRSTTSM